STEISSSHCLSIALTSFFLWDLAQEVLLCAHCRRHYNCLAATIHVIEYCAARLPSPSTKPPFTPWRAPEAGILLVAAAQCCSMQTKPQAIYSAWAPAFAFNLLAALNT